MLLHKKSRRKASDILIMADQTKQCTGSYTKNWDNETGKADKYCALGLLGCETKNIDNRFGMMSGSDSKFLYDVFEIKEEQDIIPCCSKHECRAEFCSLPGLIMHLNDDHHWSFKKIGNMLRKYE